MKLSERLDFKASVMSPEIGKVFASILPVIEGIKDDDMPPL